MTLGASPFASTAISGADRSSPTRAHAGRRHTRRAFSPAGGPEVPSISLGASAYGIRLRNRAFCHGLKLAVPERTKLLESAGELIQLPLPRQFGRLVPGWLLTAKAW